MAETSRTHAPRVVARTASRLLVGLAVAAGGLITTGATASAAVIVDQQGLLAPSDGSANDRFGAFGLAMDGDTVVVGVPNDDTDEGAEVGSVYVYVRSGTTWTEQAHLFSPSPGAGDRYGWSVAIDGDTLLVGSPFDDEAKGITYVYTRSGGTWSLHSSLQPAAATYAAQTGYSSAIDGDTLLVGARGGTAGIPGSATVYARTGTVWSEQATLLPADSQGGDRFGGAVDLDGTTAVIGAYEAKSAGVSGAGAAYVFTGTGGSWTQQAKLSHPTPGVDDFMGDVVSVSGDTVAVGVPLDDTSAGPDAGSVIVYQHAAGSWSRQQVLAHPTPLATDRFGSAVAVQGDTLIAGTPHDDTAGSHQTGSASVFTRNGTVWDHQAQVDGPAAGDTAGRRVAISGDTFVVGISDIGAAVGGARAYVLSTGDNDGDGLGDNADPDDDDDLVPDGSDNCPRVANPDQADTDGDGLPDACGDADDDGDGVADDDDDFPLDPTESVDTDGDGLGDNADTCPTLSGPDEADTDGDGLGNSCDLDDDADGLPDARDAYPLEPDYLVSVILSEQIKTNPSLGPILGPVRTVVRLLKL